MQLDLPTFRLYRIQSLVSGARLNRNLPSIRGAVGVGVVAGVKDRLPGRWIPVLPSGGLLFIVDGLVPCRAAGVGGEVGLVAVAATYVGANEFGGFYFFPVCTLLQAVSAFHIVFIGRVTSGSTLETTGFAIQVRLVQLEAAFALVKDYLLFPSLGSTFDAKEGEDVS